MSTTLQFDEETSRRAEATYMTPDFVEQRRVIRAALALGQGEHVLDIGSGPGLLACEMAAEVGAVGSVDGIDPSQSMLALARGRRAAEGCRRDPVRRRRRLRAPLRGRNVRRRGRNAGLRVRAGRAGGARGGVPGAATGWPVARARHRLGIDCVALRRRGAHAPRARCLGGASRRPPSPSAAHRAPVRCGILDRPPLGDPAAERWLRPKHHQRSA